jgi:hypothetical protein
MRQLLKSRFFIAAIAFAAVSLAAARAHFCATAPTDFPYKSWTAWAIDDFVSRTAAPRIVFLGSSLVLVPLAGVDADYLGKRLDGCEHHNSVYFERKFAERTGIKASTFNFALPGEMPSDAYMIADYLLKGEKTPDVIVYGVGPRDFMDNLLPSPAATDPYRFLSRFGDITAWAPLMMPEKFERFNFEIGRALYLYGHKEDIVQTLSTNAAQALPLVANANAMDNETLHKLLPQYRPFELHRGEAFFRPSTAEERARFTDNLDEYKKRYKQLKWDTFLTQMRFFTETLSTARRHGSHVVVVAMPITDLNRQLLSKLSWDAYRSSIKAIARVEGASFVDFSEEPSFQRTDFGDTVHLHSGGGRRWLDMVIERLAQDDAVIAQLRAQPAALAAARRQKTL